MSKRWTPADDDFLVGYYETLGPMIGPHDLGRSARATTARVKHLKDTGAWEAYRASRYHNARAFLLAGHATTDLQKEIVEMEIALFKPSLKVAE